MLNCLSCGGEFSDDDTRVRYCSDDCKKVARREAARRWRAKNKALTNKRTAEWYQRNLDREREKGRSSHKKRYNQRVRTEMHGIGPHLFMRMLEGQGFACAICRVQFERINDAHIDHDHLCCPRSTSCGNCVRGLLCKRCNMALGLLDDELERVVSAARYLHETGLAGVASV